MFEIADKDGWLGVEADTLAGARLACVTLAEEDYELPLEIVPGGEHYAIEALVAVDPQNGPIWRTTDLVRRFDGSAA